VLGQVCAVLAKCLTIGGKKYWLEIIAQGSQSSSHRAAVIATLVASRGLWGLVSDRFGWSLLPVGYRVRHPRG